MDEKKLPRRSISRERGKNQALRSREGESTGATRSASYCWETGKKIWNRTDKTPVRGENITVRVTWAGNWQKATESRSEKRHH